MQTYSASDIAKLIVRPGEATAAAVDRVRNWTDMGILRPVGEENPGRGKSRKYSYDTRQKATLIEALVNGTGMPAVVASNIVKSRQWQTAEMISEITGGVSGTHVLVWRDYNSTEVHTLAWISKVKALRRIKTSKADVHILLDMSKYLRLLKGKSDGDRS